MKAKIFFVLIISFLAVNIQAGMEMELINSVLATEEVYRVTLIESIQNNTFKADKKLKVEEVNTIIEQKKSELLDIVLSANSINFSNGKYHVFCRGKQYIIDHNFPLQLNPI